VTAPAAEKGGRRPKIGLAELNLVDEARFVAPLGWVVEGSTWVARRVAPSRPFSDVEGLHDAFAVALAAADAPAQLGVLRAHPDLGTRLKVADASRSEQAAAGLGSLPADLYQRLRSLNAQYTERFGFPFIVAVKHHTRESIPRALERRLGNSAPEELETALREVREIVRLRLLDAVTA
jgi:2-oxo-4-hydroxy-4-carboxy-5-ureidoimidazoline decarboxylase